MFFFFCFLGEGEGMIKFIKNRVRFYIFVNVGVKYYYYMGIYVIMDF